jgi:hypothetical protein
MNGATILSWIMPKNDFIQRAVIFQLMNSIL